MKSGDVIKRLEQANPDFAGAVWVVIDAPIKRYFGPTEKSVWTQTDALDPRSGQARTLRPNARADRGRSSWGLLIGTATLALAANSYELLCTAGFSMVFTRTLTLADLPSSTLSLSRRHSAWRHV